jgi:hypothetical protein
MFGMVDVQADEGPKDKKKSKVISVSESGGVVYSAQQNEHYGGLTIVT